MIDNRKMPPLGAMAPNPMMQNLIDENDKLRAERDALRADLELFESLIVSAIGGTDYLDPPDGGDVPLPEQVQRMRAERDKLRVEVERLTRERDEARSERDSMVGKMAELQRFKWNDDQLRIAREECDNLREYISTIQSGEKIRVETLERGDEAFKIRAQAQDAINEWKARAETAERKLAMAVEALTFYAAPQIEWQEFKGTDKEFVIPGFYDELDFGERARTTLAALEKNDE